MAKSNKKRLALGSVMKAPKEDRDGNNIPAEQRVGYIKINLPKNKDGSLKHPDGVVLTDGMIIRLEGTPYQKASLTEAVARGSLTPDLGDQIMDRLNKRPDFVFGEAVLVFEE